MVKDCSGGADLALGVVLLDVFLAEESLHACLGAHVCGVVSHELLVSAHSITQPNQQCHSQGKQKQQIAVTDVLHRCQDERNEHEKYNIDGHKGSPCG